MKLRVNKRLSIPLLASGIGILTTAILAVGQVPETLLHSIPDPLGGSSSFGMSVAISGSRVVIGGWNWLPPGSYAYVFDLTNATPNVPVFTLTYPNQEANDRFGNSVAIAGSLAAVGSPSNPGATNYSGRVFLYDLEAPNPDVPVVIFTNVDLGLHESALGVSVAVSEGFVVAGAYPTISSTPPGRVHVFNLNSPTPTIPMLVLTNPGPAGSTAFGTSVAIEGSRLVVGSPGDSTGAQYSGVAYVYNLASGNPVQPLVVLTNPTPAQGDEFGDSIAISGNRVVIGVAGKDAPGFVFSIGIAYVYDLASATPGIPVLTLTNSSPATGDMFGSSVAISGDIIAIGAQGDDTGTNGAGVVYMYDLSSTSPAVPIITLTNPYPKQFASMGLGVAIDGSTVVAAPGVYVFGPRPALNLAYTTPDMLTLSWTPTTSSGFTLQYSEDVSQTNWLVAPSGETNPVSISATNTARLYRLYKP